MKNDFLHGTLSEAVYFCQPTGFVDTTLPDHACRLNKSLYGLKQAPGMWYSRFTSISFLLDLLRQRQILLCSSTARDLKQYICCSMLMAFFLLHPMTPLRSIITALHKEFLIKDMGPLHHFLGISVQRHSEGLFLHQYTVDILQRTGMADCKPCSIPVHAQAKVSATMAPLLLIPLTTAALLVPSNTTTLSPPYAQPSRSSFDCC